MYSEVYLGWTPLITRLVHVHYMLWKDVFQYLLFPLSFCSALFESTSNGEKCVDIYVRYLLHDISCVSQISIGQDRQKFPSYICPDVLMQ